MAECNIKKIGLLTSGGDAPGMNAAIRSVVRTANDYGIKVVGIDRGFEGLLHGDIMELGARDVSGIMNRGGTVLHTARSAEMRTPEGVEKAANLCGILQLDALVIIGGNGSLAGGRDLAKHGVNIIGIPGTIDLDLDCTDYTIGFDTAVNTSLDCVNKIRDTSCSHERCSIVEVMGRNAGFIALWTGLTGGAEEVLVPEDPVDRDAVVEQILSNRSRGKNHNLIVVAEGVGKTQELADYIESTTGIQTRATILGHLQRGGTPTAKDRMAAGIMGYNAVKAIVEGKRNRIMIVKDGQYTDIDLEEGLAYKRPYNSSLYEIIKILAI
ncbi:MAG: 6-phosphofructokinase [Firmicutes bacterium]|nr:6-phosphofructokinase [Bacillota bacterium]MBQ9604230.1 6-phosphofructokinase [Bacillota bacterium]